MAARDRNKIFDDLVKGQGKGKKLRRKLSANKERNWLLALTLHSFEKLEANGPLTDIERTIVEAFRQHGYEDGELKEHGHFFHTMPAQAKRDLFPTKFAAFTPQTNYTKADLTADLPTVRSAILSMSNVTNVDVEAVHAGRASSSDFPMPSKEVMKQHGGAMLVAVTPNLTPPNPTYTIKATSFRCNDETGTDWLGSDEPFWIFGSLALGTTVTTRSRIFGDVDTGETRTFDPSEGHIWGQNGLPQDFPDGEVGAHIELWEHDNGDPEKIRQGVAAAFAAAAGVLTALGVTAWVGAVVAGVGAVIQWLLGFLDDDHIADQTFVFTRQTVVDQLRKAGQFFDVTRRFTDGDGDYTLTIRVSRAA